MIFWRSNTRYLSHWSSWRRPDGLCCWRFRSQLSPRASVSRQPGVAPPRPETTGLPWSSSGLNSTRSNSSWPLWNPERENLLPMSPTAFFRATSSTSRHFEGDPSALVLPVELCHSQQEYRVLECLHRIHPRRDDDQVLVAPLPLLLLRDQADAPLQDHDRGFAGVHVVVQLLPRGERDDRLPQGLLMTAVDGAGAAAAGHAVRC